MILSYKNEDDYYENENENEYEDDDDKTIDQNKITKLNDYFDKIIDKSKPFEDPIKSLNKREDLKKYYLHKDYDDKELKYKYFKIKLADMPNEIDKKLFEKIFNYTIIKLVDKLINTKNKEENQIIVKNINANIIKFDEQGKTTPYDYVIQLSYRLFYLIKAINLFLNFKERKLNNANVEFLTIRTTNEIWGSMKDIGSGIGAKNISDLVLKEIYGICETKNPSKEQVNEHKMTKNDKSIKSLLI